MRASLERLTVARRGRAMIAWAALAALFACLVLIRTRHVSESFWLLEDQERDWSEALVDLSRLRMTGSPSHVGGNTFGPLWYWLLWCARHAIGPFTSNLPHTGAIALALVQSGADMALLVAIGKRTRSWVLAVAIVLLAATAPWEVALNAAMWSPEFSVALAKITIALALTAGGRPSRRYAAAIAAAAWLTFQAHSTGVFVALPVLAALVATEWLHAGSKAAARRVLMIAVLVAILQVPFVVDVVRHPPDAVGPTVVLHTVADTVRHPASIHLANGWTAASTAAVNTLAEPWSIPAPAWVLLLCSLAAAATCRQDLVVLGATIAPFAAFVVGFALQQTPFDSYYVLPLVPGIAVAFAMSFRVLGRAARPAHVALAIVVFGIQPTRVREAWTLARFDGYGALARGSREIRRRTGDIQNIETDFALPPTTDPTYIFWALGGRVTGASKYSARISRDGGVTFTRVAP